MARAAAVTLADLRRYEQLLRYELACRDSEERLIKFAQFMMPAPRSPNDPAKSLYLPARHHEVMADLIEAMERGDVRKAFLNVPPRHGKTRLCTLDATSWMAGRNPHWDIMVATYGEKFARDFKNEIRAIINSPRFRQVFPDLWISKEGPDTLITNHAKNLFFLGRRSPTTGRGGDVVLVDDPTKDDQEARSQVWRDDVWDWFTQTLLTRRHHDRAPILVTQTRWHEDDIVGRVTDKTNPKYSQEFADGWEIVNLPALATGDNDPLGRREEEALWPERFGEAYLKEMRSANPVSFSALYQSDPTPAEGVFFLKDDIHTYSRDDLAKVEDELRYYAASDHAVATKAHSDPTCMGPFGVDQSGTAYVLPDIVWRRLPVDQAVDEMLKIMERRKPLWWYAWKDHISQSIGPFLRKRMEEEHIHVPVLEESGMEDELKRTQAARARCAQGKLLFPDFAPWWPRAKQELLKFPNGRHDDFVSMVALIGRKVMTTVSGAKTVPSSAPKPGTWGALKAEFAEQDAQERRAKAHLYR